MSTGIIEKVYKHRLLSYKQEHDQGEASEGLDMGEVLELEQLESELGELDLQRGYERYPLEIAAMLGHRDILDRVPITDLSYSGIGLKGCPHLRRGETVFIELVSGHNGDRYRFEAQVVRLRLVGEEREVGLRFVGRPLHMRTGPQSATPSESAIDKLASRAL